MIECFMDSHTASSAPTPAQRLPASQPPPKPVIPAKAGISRCRRGTPAPKDPSLRWGDGHWWLRPRTNLPPARRLDVAVPSPPCRLIGAPPSSPDASAAKHRYRLNILNIRGRSVARHSPCPHAPNPLFALRPASPARGGRRGGSSSRALFAFIAIASTSRPGGRRDGIRSPRQRRPRPPETTGWPETD